MTSNPNYTRTLELLADQAVGQLSHDDAKELSRLLAEPGAPTIAEFERIVAAADAAMQVSQDANEPMPAEVSARLKHAADAFCAGRVASGPSSLPFTGLAVSPPRTRSWGALAAAAVLVFTAVTALYFVSRPGEVPPAQLRLAMLTQPNVKQVAWTDWAVEGAGPEIPGVQGDVVWSDSAQKGYMRFTGLPANNPTKQQYQLWIIDKERGMGQRISGGVFDGGPGEIVVPIEPRLMVNKAAAFAVTIEQPGGTWVSDMTRRVNIAMVPD
jgi:anti-sigma-K factor RskA